MNENENVNAGMGENTGMSENTGYDMPQEPPKRNYERYLDGDPMMQQSQPEPFLAGGFESGTSPAFEQNIPKGNQFASLGGIPAPDPGAASDYMMPPEENASQNGWQSGYQEAPQYGAYPDNNYQGGYPGGGPVNTPVVEGLEEPVSMGEWFICMLLMIVPCVNIIMMFVWAFSKNEKKSKSNYFKVQLIVMGVMLALYLVFFILIAAAGVGLAGMLG